MLIWAEMVERLDIAWNTTTRHSRHKRRGRIYLAAGRGYSHHRMRSLNVLVRVMRHSRTTHGMPRDATGMLGHSAGVRPPKGRRSHRSHFRFFNLRLASTTRHGERKWRTGESGVRRRVDRARNSHGYFEYCAAASFDCRRNVGE